MNYLNRYIDADSEYFDLYTLNDLYYFVSQINNLHDYLDFLDEDNNKINTFLKLVMNKVITLFDK